MLSWILNLKSAQYIEVCRILNLKPAQTWEDRCCILTVSGSWIVTDFTPARITFLAVEGEREGGRGGKEIT